MLARGALERLAALERELARRRADSPLERMRWLPGQLAFLRSGAKRKLFRAGSQAQRKTTVGAAELIYRLLGRHPYRAVRPAPIRAWVLCGGGEQSRIVQERIWSLVPRHAVAAGFGYDARKGGFIGKYPRLRLTNGSEVEIKSGQQDTLNLSSGTLDYIWIDEPPESERVYAELVKRVLAANGDIGLTLTPVNRPVDWLHELCEAGQIEDLHWPLTPAALVPVGGVEPTRLLDGTVCDAAWIEAVIAETPPHEVPVTVHGEWEFRAGGAYFDGAWLPDRHITASPPPGEIRLLLGMDHGDRPGKEVAYLIAVDEGRQPHPYVYVLDEYVATTGRETPEDDARGILAMLRRNGFAWSQLWRALGDRVHAPTRAQRKSNLDLHSAVAKVLGVSARGLRPRVETAKRGEGRGAGSVGVRSRWLFHAMRRDSFGVHPRCTRLIDAIPRYTGRDDDAKDPIDAIVYGCDPYVYGQWRRGAVRPPPSPW